MTHAPQLAGISAVLATLLAGCGLVTLQHSGNGPIAQCAAVVPVETFSRRDRMKVVAAAERGRFVASTTAFNDSDNDGAFEVAVGQPLLVTRCDRDDTTLYTALGRVVRMPTDQAGARLTDKPERWNVDDERSAQGNSTESVLANASKDMIEEAAATNVLAARSRCLEVKLGACQRAQRAVETGPPVADLPAARTSACATAGDKAYAACFDEHDAHFLAVMAALRELEQRADAAQKDVVRRKFN